MLDVIIVDDEPLALDVMETHLNKISDINIVKKCGNALEAAEILKTTPIDIAFLDIQMPQITGIDFVKTLENPPNIIFTTAYPNYAVEGFEVNAIDYLLKPISLERLMKAINKVRSMKGENGTSQNNGGDGEDFMFVKADKKLIKVNYKDILYIEGLKDYVIIRMNDSRVITLQTMKSLEEKLPSHLFKRIHRSYIVGITKVRAIIGNMVEIKEKDKAKHLPIGKNYRDALLEIINKNRL